MKGMKNKTPKNQVRVSTIRPALAFDFIPFISFIPV
jgi:hypothetical protein